MVCKNKEKVREYHRMWREKHPEYLERYREYNKRYWEKKALAVMQQEQPTLMHRKMQQKV